MVRCNAVCGVLACVGAASVANAGTLTVTLTAPNTYSAPNTQLEATATFANVGGGILEVILTNSALTDVSVPSDVLTAVFFDAGATLSPVSALIGSGSSIIHTAGNLVGSAPAGPYTAGYNVGGEWAYGAFAAGAPHSAAHGISSSGFDLFGGPNFNGVNLGNPNAVDGLNFGITSAGDNIATGNTPVTGSLPLIKHQVVFRLSGISANFDPMASISNVSFQYGTALDEPNLWDSTIPLPSTAALGLAGLLTVGARRRRV